MMLHDVTLPVKRVETRCGALGVIVEGASWATAADGTYPRRGHGSGLDLLGTTDTTAFCRSDGYRARPAGLRLQPLARPGRQRNSDGRSRYRCDRSDGSRPCGRRGGLHGRRCRTESCAPCPQSGRRSRARRTRWPRDSGSQPCYADDGLGERTTAGRLTAAVDRLRQSLRAPVHIPHGERHLHAAPRDSRAFHRRSEAGQGGYCLSAL